MTPENIEIYEMHAEFCKTIASPKRLMIIALLGKNEMSVSELMKALEVPLSNVSQHLRVLRSRHIVKTRKEGQTVYYSLSDPRLPGVCSDIRTILLDGMKEQFKKTRDITG
jgi:DNA-binding transcriptional ArsR family regulator